MKILFFSEIRWDYIPTRKQQLLSRFPKDWQILFFQPYKAGNKMNLAPEWHDNICAVTMPLFFKNFKPAWIKRILSFKIVRFFILAIGFIWVVEIIRRTKFHAPNLIMASNIYAAPLVKILAGDRIPMIYEMNDNHLAFPDTPAWARKYFESLCAVASRIVMPSESMQELLPVFVRLANSVVTNGVDYARFQNDRRIILYVGTISERIDVELLSRVAVSFPNETIRLIGPVVTDVRNLGRLPNVEFIGALDRRLVVEQIKQASVCLVPFLACELTKHTETSINKVYEYLAAGKPVVSIGRPKARFEDENPGLIYSAATINEFIEHIKTALSEETPSMLTEMRKTFAQGYDWDNKAREMVAIINGAVA